MTGRKIRMFATFAALSLASCSVYGPELLEGGVGRGGDSGGAMPTGGASPAGDGGGGVAGASGAGGVPAGTGAAPPLGDAGPKAPEGGPDPCGGSAVVPSRPDAAVVPDALGDAGDIVFAMYTVDLGDRMTNAITPPEAYLELGLDIDGTCTSGADPTAARCVLSSWATGSLDGPLGIDNAVGPFLQSVRDIVGVAFSSEQYTRQIQAGDTNLIYRVRGYNGEANDDQVGVAAFIAAPFELGKDGGGAPAWDGTDVWPVSTASVETPAASEPLESPKVVDGAAYVADWRLVASFPRFFARIEIGVSTLSMSRLDVELSGARLVCDLAPGDAGQYHAKDCILAGRWRANHLLKQLSHFSDPTSTTGFAPICTDNTLYTAFKNKICSRTDVADAAADESAPCNALSVGIAFSARAARLGSVQDLEPIADRCPAEIEPRSDCCETLAADVSDCP